jgi:signal transduction histidine kinase
LYQEITDVVKEHGKGWVQYKFTNPTTKKEEIKESYVEGYGDIVVGCGYYKK